MASRRTSLSDYADLAIAREIDSKYDDVRTVADNIDKVILVADNIEDIDTLKAIAEDVTTVANIQVEVTALANIAGSITALHEDINVLNSLYADKVKLDSIFADKNTLDSLYADKVVLDSLYADKTKLDEIYANLITINSVYADLVNINTVATNIVDVNIIADDIVGVNTVSNNIDNVNIVALDKDNVDMVAGNILDVNTIADNITDVNTLVTHMPEVVTVYTDILNIDTVASNILDINTVVEQVVPNIPEILLVDDKAAQVALDASDVATMKLAVESLYNSFDNRFLGSKDSDPVVDNDGNPLLDGALYFNTSSNTLRVYDEGNSVWLVIPQLYLSGLLDVELVSIASGDVLVWNGTKWNNTNLQTAISTNSEVLANTSARHTHSNKLVLDVIDQELSMLSTPKFNSVQLNGGTGDQGVFSWDANNETAILDMGNYRYPLGQALPLHCTKYNGTGNIAKGRPVVAMGTTGGSCKILIAEATLANWRIKDPSATEVPAKYVLGVTAEAITNNGAVMCFGKVKDIIGATYSQGTVYYVDEINGGFTDVRPTSGLVMPMAFAINSNTLMVRVTPINELEIDKGVIGYNHSISMGTYSDFDTAFTAAEAN